ncbi:hypothetical protein [Undibacterium sp.]|uniref:hypothetical protein n=1 Tax=Undibacterium sp. TaxID=1914977 RepID=UPI00374D75BC
MKLKAIVFTLAALAAGVSFAQSAPASAPAATTAATAKAAAKAPAASAAASAKASAAAKPVAPGGGPGKVWVNTKSNVYHCENTKSYGTTKVGAYMTEAEAKAKGAHANHGKACS